MAKEDKIQQILICAKELFGLYGYDKVSMRDIADRAGISVGNLTYYYGRKERIMLAVLDQINEEVSRPADIPGTLAEVDAMLERFSKIAAQSSCLFRRYSLDEQLGEKMLQCQKNLVRANRGLWAETLRSLERSGQLCGELYSGHYSELITAIQMVVPVLGWLCRDGREHRQPVSPVPSVHLEPAAPEPHRSRTPGIFRAYPSGICAGAYRFLRI